ncbi:tetratricopeptide (TPR) repeat protein [Bosea sp. BE125]|uniref:tetratricopeptide repeat protein n=1 Tax=Bosea sp. BE125 TaxID=2817909 RepID=UPI00285D39F8|nr:tetratricopeptide repeat protein [Bosea sp. BE125]MDR6870250.1 tetratricopeptide (TPR) repeat protein [Bosea sp. BE125]
MLARSAPLLPALAALGLASAVMMTGQAVADGGPGAPSASPVEDLRRTCRSGSEPSLAVPLADAQALIAQAQEIIARHDRALAACNRLIDTGGLAGGELATALLDRGDLLAPGTGDAYARALADYDGAIALAPTLAVAFAKRGKAHLLYMRDLRRALRDLDTAIRLDPSQADFLVTRASIRASLGEPDRALTDLDRAIALAPALEKAWTVRGLTHFNKGDTARAITDFGEAIRLAPDSDGNYRFRAAARRAAGDQDGARADEAKLGELSSRNTAPSSR